MLPTAHPGQQLKHGVSTLTVTFFRLNNLSEEEEEATRVEDTGAWHTNPGQYTAHGVGSGQARASLSPGCLPLSPESWLGTPAWTAGTWEGRWQCQDIGGGTGQAPP